jgi:hypothetical protein
VTNEVKDILRIFMHASHRLISMLIYLWTVQDSVASSLIFFFPSIHSSMLCLQFLRESYGVFLH